MAVPSYTPPTKSITFKGIDEPLVVRGLSLEDVTALVNEHLPDITLAVEQYGAHLNSTYSTKSLDGFLGTMLSGFPALAAAVIAQAADDLAAIETVRRYPTGVQIAALVAVAELTLDDMGTLADPSPALATLVRNAMSSLGQRKTPSLGSSGLSDATSAG